MQMIESTATCNRYDKQKTQQTDSSHFNANNRKTSESVRLLWTEA